MLSELINTLAEGSMASNPLMTPVISMRLLVVWASLPEIIRWVPFLWMMAAQPPGPGFPLHAPSVWMTMSLLRIVAVSYQRSTISVL